MDKNIELTKDEKDFITHAKEALGILPLDVKIKKLDERAVIPTYAHDGDVGMDMTAIDVEYDDENDMYIYHTGLAFESDKHYGQLLFPRSSNRKTDAYLCNSVGIADSAIYRGEIMFCFKNRTSIHVLGKINAMEHLINKLQHPERKDEENKSFLDVYSEFRERARNLEFAPYNVGDRIGQMVFVTYPEVRLNIVDELSDTERGEGGLGSTGN